MVIFMCLILKPNCQREPTHGFLRVFNSQLFIACP